jgi:hypothetical protein
MLTGSAIIAIVVSGCADPSSPSTTEGEDSFESDTSLGDAVEDSAEETASAENCVAQTAESDPPPGIHVFLGPGPFIGSGGIWTGITTDAGFDVINSDPATFDAILKMPWFRVGAHHLEVVMTDPDGNMPAGSFESSRDAYAPEGVLPSTLLFDSPGCWTVHVAYGPDTLEFPLWVPRE